MARGPMIPKLWVHAARAFVQCECAVCCVLCVLCVHGYMGTTMLQASRQAGRQAGRQPGTQAARQADRQEV
jgi:hypothetical protein